MPGSDLVVRVGADLKEFSTKDVEQSLKGLDRSVSALGDSATAAVSGPLSRLHDTLAGVGKVALSPVSAVGGLVDGLGKLGIAALGLKTLATGIAGIATGMVSGNAEMETYETQLGTLLGSADAAKERLAELAKFGAETPFELPEVVRAEKVLLGFGLTGQKAVQMTGKSATDLRTIIGDIAAGTGASFEEIALNFGKFSAGATGEAISRFQEMGIVTREQLTAMGIQFSKSGELISPLPEAMAAAVKIAQSKFGGGMDKLSKTFSGQMSTLADNFNQAKNAITQPIFDVLKNSVAGLNDFLSSGRFQAALNDVARVVAEAVKGALDLGGKAVTLFRGAVDAALPTLKTLINYFKAVVETGDPFNDFLADLPAPLATVSGLIGGLYTGVQKLIGPMQAFVTSLGEFVTTQDVGVLAGAIQQLSGLDIDPVVEPLQALVDFLVNQGGNAVATVQQLVQALSLAASGNFAAAWETVKNVVGAFIQETINNVSDLVTTLGGWALRAIPPMLAGLADLGGQLVGWVVGQVPVLLARLATWGKAFVDWIGPVVAALPGALLGVATAAVTWIGQQVQPLLAKLGEWKDAFLGWVGPLVKSLPDKLVTVAAAALAWIGDQAKPILDKLGAWASSFLDWVVPLVKDLPNKLADVVSVATKWIADTAPVVLAKLSAWKDAFLNWVGPLVSSLPAKLDEIKNTITAWVTGTAIPAIKTAWDKLEPAIVPTITGALASARDKLRPIWTEITTFMADFEPTGKRLEALFGTIGNVLRDSVAPALLAVANRFGELFQKVGLLLGGEGGGKGPSLMKLIADYVNSWSRGAELAATGLGKVAGALKSVWEWLDKIISRLNGKSLWDTIWGATPLGVISNLLDVLVAAKGTGTASTTTNAPFRANGGSVLSGNPYWVGERGRELFVPDTSGVVVPNAAMRAGGGIDYDRLARAMSGVSLAVAVDDIHGALLRKQGRNVSLGLA